MAALDITSEIACERAAETAIHRAARSADYAEARAAFKEKRAQRIRGE